MMRLSLSIGVGLFIHMSKSKGNAVIYGLEIIFSDHRLETQTLLFVFEWLNLLPSTD